MNIRQHLINVKVNRVPEDNDVIKLVTNYCPACMYKKAQTNVLLEQDIHDAVSIYAEAKDYIICELRSTIQHEGQHRSDELDWQQVSPESQISFEELTAPGKAEINPERAEEHCIVPELVSGQVENITINDLFEEAKSQANIDPVWKQDIMAATLADGVAGQYLMKTINPDEVESAHQIGNNVYRMGNKLLIDVRKQVQPWITEKTSLPSNIQTARDGAVTPDPDLQNLQTQTEEQSSAFPTVPAIPTL